MAKSSRKRDGLQPAAVDETARGLQPVVVGMVVTTLTVLVSNGGLIVVWPIVQLGVLGGLVAGLMAPSKLESALVAVFGVALGMSLVPTGWQQYASVTALLLAVAGAVAIAGAVAVGLRIVLDRWSVPPRVVVYLVVGLLIANMWATTLILDAKPLEVADGSHIASEWEELSGDNGHFAAFDTNSDPAWYYRVYTSMRRGNGYYPSFATVLRNNPNWAPTTVTQFKLPTLFWLWALLPTGQSIVFAFLVLASVGVLLVIPVAQGVVELPLILPGCAAVASYFVFFSTTPLVLSLEIWGVVFAMASLAAAAASIRSKRWRAMVVTSVVCAVAAVLIRETLIFALLGGLVAAVLAKERRRFMLVSWGSGALVVVAAVVAHIVVTRPYLVSGPTQFVRGGIGNAVSAVTYATDTVGGPHFLVFVLALLGLLGAAALPDRGLRSYAIALTAAPLLSFLFVANQTTANIGGQSINVWGAGVVPLLYMLVPIGLGLLSGTVVHPEETR